MTLLVYNPIKIRIMLLKATYIHVPQCKETFAFRADRYREKLSIHKTDSYNYVSMNAVYHFGSNKKKIKNLLPITYPTTCTLSMVTMKKSYPTLIG